MDVIWPSSPSCIIFKKQCLKSLTTSVASSTGGWQRRLCKGGPKVKVVKTFSVYINDGE
jgi:hypothetical protein